MALNPSQRIELAIYRYVAQVGAERATTLAPLCNAARQALESQPGPRNADDKLIVALLKFLYAHGWIRLFKYITAEWAQSQSQPTLRRQVMQFVGHRVAYSEGQTFWINPEDFFFVGEFIVEITPAGRPHFESLEREEEFAMRPAPRTSRRHKFDIRGPYPTNLEGVYEEIDYWASHQNEGEPGSPHEEAIRNRIEYLRDLERRLQVQRSPSDGELIFISCGQYTATEKKLGRSVVALVTDLTPYSPYFADLQSSLQGLTDNILGKLHQCAGFISIMHPRGEVVFPNGSRHTRASVWIEQEVAIAAFIEQVLKRPIRVAAYVHTAIKREGMRDQLHLNPLVFEDDEEVLDSLRTILPTWKDLSAAHSSPLRLSISYKQVKITRERHDYELVVRVDNSGTERVEQYHVDVLFPAVFLDKSATFALEVPGKRTQTHRLFRATELSLRQPLYPDTSQVLLTVPYFVDRDIYGNQEEALDLTVKATLYAKGLQPVETVKSMRELQVF